ncbi:hypothetical protein [Streptomyces sp. SID10815]|uniref:hypothetical protein n=1 Tax=Streptomyces sp. SID10815 TaxID=2706027 RepID=UPI0013CDC1BE|nr:hypothetical protein [Streptomyces sp. SID10815]NEA52411.1 hypothetical protein [Streptomyces sp. SID10815]
MTEHRIPADEFRVGDVVHIEQRAVEVRRIERGPGGRLTVNPGDPDQLDGHAWQWADTTRED